MKHRNKIIGVIAAVMLLASLTAIPVMAQPPTPCAFSGDVTLDGAATPGSIVTVKLADGTPVATTPAQVVVGADSRYGVVVPQDAGTLLPAQGDTLNFYVNGFFGGSSTWAAGGLKTVNLAAETDTVEPPNGDDDDDDDDDEEPEHPPAGTFARHLHDTFIKPLM